MVSLTFPPYLGVTGIVTSEDADLVASLRPEVWQRLERRLMVGILASAKTWRGERVRNSRYPPVARIPALVAALPSSVWPVLHVNAPRTEPLAPFLLDLLDRCPGIQGVQLNLVQPAPEALARVREARPNIELILQVNRPSVPTLTPEAVDAYVRRYAGVVQHMLLDLSGGTGKGLDPSWTRAVLEPYARAWLRSCGIRPGLAGGLGPGCHSILSALGRAMDPLLLAECSIDAESGVRVPVADPIPGEHHQDQLDGSRLATYVRDAVRGLTQWLQIALLERALLRDEAAPGTVVRLREAADALGVVTVAARTATGPGSCCRVMPVRVGVARDQTGPHSLWVPRLPGVGEAVALLAWADGPVPLADIAIVSGIPAMDGALLDLRRRFAAIDRRPMARAELPAELRGTGPDETVEAARPWAEVWSRSWRIS